MRLLRTILLTSAIVCSFSLLTGCQDSTKSEPTPEPIIESVQTQEKVPPAIDKTTPKVNKTVTATKPKETIKKTVKAAETKGAPKIVFEKTSHNFGVMVPNKYYDAEYKFTNAGNRELVITRTNATCGCTVPKLEKKNYAPGESGVIKVKYHAQKNAGSVTKNIQVYTNDPVTRMVKCYIRGSVEVAVAVEPKTLKFSLKEENAGAVPIVVKSTTGKPFSISQVKDGAGAISFDFDPTQQATEFTLIPKVDLEKLKKRLVGSILITANTPDINQLSLTYSTPPLFEVSRPNIIIQNADPAKPQEKEIWITSNYADKLQIDSITSVKNYMKVLKQESHGNRIKLTIQITPPIPEGKKRHFTDKLEIKITDSEALSVRCSGWYKRK
jgi:hypothetical protein